MNLILDAGALIGLDGGNRRVLAALQVARNNSVGIVTVAPVVGQAWRNGARQAVLSRWIPWIDIRPTDLEDAKDAGELLGSSRTSDVVDALLALLISNGDRVLTSDVGDIKALLADRRTHATIIVV